MEHNKNKLFEEAVAGRCSVQMMFLKISQNSQENTCVRVSFVIKLKAWSLKHLRTTASVFFQHVHSETVIDAILKWLFKASTLQGFEELNCLWACKKRQIDVNF